MKLNIFAKFLCVCDCSVREKQFYRCTQKCLKNLHQKPSDSYSGAAGHCLWCLCPVSDCRLISWRLCSLASSSLFACWEAENDGSSAWTTPTTIGDLVLDFRFLGCSLSNPHCQEHLGNDSAMGGSLFLCPILFGSAFQGHENKNISS